VVVFIVAPPSSAGSIAEPTPARTRVVVRRVPLLQPLGSMPQPAPARIVVMVRMVISLVVRSRCGKAAEVPPF
jgi:hypothetical protein